MKVKSVDHFLVNPGWGKNLLFVKVTTDNGLVGWGECYTQSDRDKTIVVHIDHLSTYLIGRDPFEIKYFNQIVFDEVRLILAIEHMYHFCPILMLL